MTDGPNESVPPKNSLSSFVGLAFHPLVCLLGLCALRVGEGTVLQHLVHEAARVNCPPGSQVNSPIVLSYLTPVSNSFLACFIVSLFRGRKVGTFSFHSETGIIIIKEHGTEAKTFARLRETNCTKGKKKSWQTCWLLRGWPYCVSRLCHSVLLMANVTLLTSVHVMSERTIIRQPLKKQTSSFASCRIWNKGISENDLSVFQWHKPVKQPLLVWKCWLNCKVDAISVTLEAMNVFRYSEDGDSVADGMVNTITQVSRIPSLNISKFCFLIDKLKLFSPSS